MALCRLHVVMMLPTLKGVFRVFFHKYTDLVINFQNGQVVCTPADNTKKAGGSFQKEKRKKERKKKVCKTQTLTASIQPNNKDILQILLAITYFTSCNKKSKIKDEKHKYKIDIPPRSHFPKMYWQAS